MKKFVRYLYAYKDGRCIQNIGFVKCEESTDKVSLQIYGKGFPADGDDRFELFVIYSEGEQCIGISMGTLENTSPVFSYRLEYDADDLGGMEIFERINGLVLIKGQGARASWYAAKWEEDAQNIEQMIRRENLEEPEETEIETEEEPKENLEEAPVEEGIQEEPIEAPVEEVIQKESIEAAEKELIYKITREDLAKLPRCEWKLANNHFLLHGYGNYHHLVSFEKSGSCWLGVPGVFHPNEQKVARAFGFDQFMRPDEGEIELSKEQREEDEEFGYWCRKVSAVIEE